MKQVSLLLCALLIAGCATSHSRQGHEVEHPARVSADVDVDQIVERKARKYGINPNLVHAVAAAEMNRCQRVVVDSAGADWIAEQAARILSYILKHTRSSSLAVQCYASGSFAIAQDLDREARTFASAVISDFERREKANKWQGWKD